MLNPIQLRTLVTVLRTGSFADAARELGYTPSAVSQQIAALERQVRFPLFERTARSISPTPAARQLAELARDPLIALDALDEAVAAMGQGRMGLLRLGSFPTASQRLVPTAISGFRTAQPQVEIRLDEAEADVLAVGVAEGQLDLAVVYDYDLVPRPVADGVVAVPLLDEDLVLLVPEWDDLGTGAGAGGGPGPAWRDLGDRTWVSTRPGTAGAECLARLCAQAGFEPTVGVRSNDYDVIRECVRLGLGIALVPGLSHRPTAGIRALRPDGTTASRHVRVLHRPSAGPAVVGFVTALRDAAAGLGGEFLRSR